jgi:hypothetical protein
MEEKKYKIRKFFDTYFECNVAINLTKEEADEMLKKLGYSACYVSYDCVEM